MGNMASGHCPLGPWESGLAVSEFPLIFKQRGPYFQVVPGPAYISWLVLAVLSGGRFARKAESGRQGPALTAAPCLLTKHVTGVLT